MEHNNYPKSYEGNEAYAFISYAHKDSEAVWSIIHQMNSDQYRVWYDDGIEPGTEWDDNIAEHIEKCSYFIAFISEMYLKSENCRDELNYARDLNKDRVLVYIEEVQLSGGLAMRLRRLQSIRKYKFTDEKEFYEKLYQAKNLSICKIKECSVPKEIQKLYKEIGDIDKDWGRDNSQDTMALARDLYAFGIFSINSEVKDRLLYLSIVCNDFTLSNNYLVTLITTLSVGELKKRYEKYMQYVTKYQIRLATMTLSIERIEEYESYFCSLGLDAEQIKSVMSVFIDMGDYVKRIDKVKEATDKIEIFDVSIEKRNQFICKAATLLYNDFLRKTDVVFDEMIEAMGKEKAFEKLLEDPELLRRY